LATGKTVEVGAPSLMADDFLAADKVVVLDGKKVEPYAYVVSANIHRRHLAPEQKRELIAKLIKAAPEKSDRQIATTAKTSPTTGGTVRATMESEGEVSKLDTRIDAKGIKQPAKKSTDALVRAGERARARREAKRKQKNEELRNKRDAEEAAAEVKAAQL